MISIRSWMLSLLVVSSVSFGDTGKREFTFEKTKDPIKYKTGLKLDKGWSKKVTFKEVKIQAALPRHFDWREQGQLTPIKDQGDCGACWSFSTTATLQDVLALHGQGQINLSEQYLLSCNKDGWSCNGGWFAHDYHKALPVGAVLASDFPYQAKQVACKPNLNHPYHLASWAYLPSKDENTPPSLDAIKSAIYTYGPISVGVGANDAFMSYSSGVFNQCDGTQPNHAVNLVGWDDDGQYFIMRNSWGAWGENNSGYMRIHYGCNNIGIAANYIILNSPNPNPPQPIPKCTPEPQANAGSDVSIYKGRAIKIGTPPKANTTYHWESSIKSNFPLTAQIIVHPTSSRTYTVFATTKCGTVHSTVMVTVK